MRNLLRTLLLFVAVACTAQTPTTKITNLSVGGLANGDNFLVYADANGILHVTPWTTNQFYWITNSSGAGLGFSNTVSPVTVFGTFRAANLNGTVGSLTNGGFLNPSFTNGANYGNPFDSPGAASGSLQIGHTAAASSQGATAIGNNAGASPSFSTALGYSAGANGYFSTALGANALASDTNTTALGYSANVNSGHTNSTAIGAKSSTTGPNQVMIGSGGGGGIPAISAVINNYLQVLGGLTVANGATNLWLTGTNTFLAGSDVAFTRYALSTLANGNNAAIPVGTNVFVEVSGPSGAFTVNGIAGQPNRDGKVLILKNATGFTMTIANQSGTDPTPGNRILTGYSADHAYTNNPGLVTLIYDGNAARWLVVSQNGNQ